MSDRTHVDGVLGEAVAALAAQAAERWALGDLDGAHRLAAGAWRLTGSGEFVDRERFGAQREATQ